MKTQFHRAMLVLLLLLIVGTRLHADQVEDYVRGEMKISHTSGLPYFYDDEHGYLAITRGDILQKIATMPLEEPSEKARYNQTGYLPKGDPVGENHSMAAGEKGHPSVEQSRRPPTKLTFNLNRTIKAP